MACYLQLQQDGHLLLSGTTGALLLTTCNDDNNGWLGGGADLPHDEWHHPTGKVKRYETAAELALKLLDSFKEKPAEQVAIATPVMAELRELEIPNIPIPDFSLTYEQIEDIRQTIIAELLLMLEMQKREDEIILMAAALVL